jgi:hypothetical protein
MELGELLKRTEEYITGEWHLRTPTIQENPLKKQYEAQCKGCDDVTGLFPPIKTGLDLGDITEDAQHLTIPEAVKKINSNIPNSPENQLVDFCAGTGIYFTHGFAKRHPNVRVLIVDKIGIEQLLYSALTQKEFELKAREQGLKDADFREIIEKGFERYETGINKHGNVPRCMEELFVVNGAHNMHYADKLIEQASIPQDKKTYCIGWNCPADAGIEAIQKAVEAKAEAIAVTISGIDQATKMSTTEMPASVDYSKPDQMKLGFAHKNLRVINTLQWLEKQGYKTRLVLLDQPLKTYNGAEHIIYAYKNEDILK